MANSSEPHCLGDPTDIGYEEDCHLNIRREQGGRWFDLESLACHSLFWPGEEGEHNALVHLVSYASHTHRKANLGPDRNCHSRQCTTLESILADPEP